VNTRFGYLYRHASNYKQWGAVVFSGVASEAIERRLTATLDSGEFFIADQVRVPELFFHDGLAVQDDPCWHEFVALEVTTEDPTDAHARSIADFVEECETAARDGWRAFDPRARELSRHL
jgi:hypothetical protein